jgi:hypothetical protein
VTVVHITSALQRRPSGQTWQRVALHYRVRDYAAVMDAVCAMDSDNLAIERGDWMIVAQGVSQKQAALVALFLPHPEDMAFFGQSKQITIFPI